MRNAGLDEAQASVMIAGRSISNLRYADDTTLMAESEEELESLEIHGWFMSMYDKTHYNTVISLQLIKINEKKK